MSNMHPNRLSLAWLLHLVMLFFLALLLFLSSSSSFFPHFVSFSSSSSCPLFHFLLLIFLPPFFFILPITFLPLLCLPPVLPLDRFSSALHAFSSSSSSVLLYCSSSAAAAAISLLPILLSFSFSAHFCCSYLWMSLPPLSFPFSSFCLLTAAIFADPSND